MSMKKSLIAGFTALAFSSCIGSRQGAGGAESHSGVDPCLGDPCGSAAEGIGPLGVGAGYENWTALTTDKWRSETHGGRMVLTYVNDVGVEAYKNEDTEIPVGTVIVKPSWERDGATGPVFVMEKRAAGYAPDNDNWYYALYWPEIAAKWQKKFDKPVYWESPSSKVNYCVNCHENYERELGGIPDEVKSF